MSDINKLPKWAQEYIHELERQRDVAVHEMEEYLDNQTPSAFYVYDLVTIPDEKSRTRSVIRYIQTHRMEVEHDGVHLNIILRDGYIDLHWGLPDYHHGDVAFIPQSYNSARLVAKENMR